MIEKIKNQFGALSGVWNVLVMVFGHVASGVLAMLRFIFVSPRDRFDTIKLVLIVGFLARVAAWPLITGQEGYTLSQWWPFLLIYAVMFGLWWVDKQTTNAELGITAIGVSVSFFEVITSFRNPTLLAVPEPLVPVLGTHFISGLSNFGITLCLVLAWIEVRWLQNLDRPLMWIILDDYILPFVPELSLPSVSMPKMPAMPKLAFAGAGNAAAEKPAREPVQQRVSQKQRPVREVEQTREMPKAQTPDRREERHQAGNRSGSGKSKSGLPADLPPRTVEAIEIIGNYFQYSTGLGDMKDRWLDKFCQQNNVSLDEWAPEFAKWLKVEQPAKPEGKNWFWSAANAYRDIEK